MSDESSGAGQGALPPRECPPSRGVAERPAMRLSQVSGHIVFTSQPHATMPALTQINAQQGGGTTRIISLSPGRIGSATSSLRPSVANQNIVNALSKPRPAVGVRLQLFPTTATSSPAPSNLKRSLPVSDERAVKLQRLLDHRNVRSKIVREKYNEHLAEKYFLETQGNILDLPTFTKRQRTAHFLAYIDEHSIEARDAKQPDDDDDDEVEDDEDDEEDEEEYEDEEQLQQQQHEKKEIAPTIAPPTTATLAVQHAQKGGGGGIVTGSVNTSTPVTASSSSVPTASVASSAPAKIQSVSSSSSSSSSVKSNSRLSSISSGGQDPQLMEKARQEATVLQRVNDLQKEGLWSEKRLPKVQEQSRTKAHWDFLLEEMVWLAADFAQERKWKKAAAKKCARMVQKHFQDKVLAAQRAEKAHEQHLRRVAAFCAKEVRSFWNSVEKLVEFKQNTWIEAKRKRALDQHLSFIVDQTEKYSQLLAEGMNKSSISGAGVSGELMPSGQSSRANSDDEFQPNHDESTDDEETIAQEEEACAADSQNQGAEVEALQRESEMDLDAFLKVLPKDYLQNRDKISLTHSSGDSSDDDDAPLAVEQEEAEEEEEEEEDEDEQSDERKVAGNDDEFVANSCSEEDDEDTIQEQEKMEGKQDHAREIRDLEAENELSVEELRKKYSSLPPPLTALNDNCEDSDDASGDEEQAAERDETSEGESEFADDGDDGDVGLRSLLDDSSDFHKETKTDKDDLINDAAAIAESIQPKGNTLSSTSVVTPIPFLLKYQLREYQHIGLDWLVTMYERKLNGILADEMGLGKTIQTIALLAHLACEKGNWGPHLIIVPTSVMLNWEMECKKWCPAFKILTYYGSQKERKQKRTGWTKPNAFHICVTSYKLVIQDHQSFRRKKWKYLILDEAQNIKNFKSQRWQLLLNFQSQQRLLLTGTPLQNNLMELWSLMHFLMPHVFQSHREFREWFSNPVTGMIEGNSEYNESIIKRLHKVLRPFLLRRLKCEVEKQMPKKYEHVVMCRLSKRQRFLYDDYMSRTKTRETLATGNLLSVINVLMQLRKVCNHPNLFEVRPTVSPFQCDGITWHIPSTIYGLLDYDVWSQVHLSSLNLNFVLMEFFLSAYQCYRMRQYQTPRRKLVEETDPLRQEDAPPYCPPAKLFMRVHRLANVKKENAEKANLRLKINPSTHAQALRVSSTSNKELQTQGTPSIVSSNKVVKLHLTTVSTPASVLPAAAATVEVTEIKSENDIGSSKKLIGSKFIEKLYSNQSKTLDVRWRKAQKPIPRKNRHADVEVTDHRRNKLELLARVNDRRCSAVPLYGKDFHDSIKILKNTTECAWSGGRIHCLNTLYHLNNNDVGTDCLNDLLFTPERRIDQLKDIFDRFVFYVPAVRAPEPAIRVWHPQPSTYWGRKRDFEILSKYFSKPATCLHSIASAMVTQFPDPRLIQYDCGKLQTLHGLLRRLKAGGHRVLIFTQMTKMLNVLEAFLNFHGHIYLRLDGSTKVDQRQVLMERFNGDPRIFAFILSTRSGGIGVNLTGADTVIFYDSDWNPTMDAQAQDRCHRIGQTRDVHIYRLVSERTIEENILKKANQKRLLGDLAIEGGNFTTAFFKSSTIQDLFNIDNREESAANRMSDIVESSREREEQSGEEKNAIGALESALAACEDDQDVQAATIAKAEAVADLAEFDETIPLEEQDKEKEPEASKAEQEVENIIKQLTPIERYAIRFIEETEAAWSAAQLAAAEKEIEEQKREWEQNRLAALREEEERRARNMEEDADLLTYSREDATNQIWMSDNTMEQMPMWCPPTPPQQDTDVYMDPTLNFLYEPNVMCESQLPPVYVRKDCKRSRHEANLLLDARRALKLPRKEESFSCAPRSLFERPSPALVKMRRDLKMKKHVSGVVRPSIPMPGGGGAKAPTTAKPTSNNVVVPVWHNWTIHEDMALLKVIQSFQGLPLNLMLISPGHTPNWDFVADYVNTVSITYRTPKQCRHRYETVIIPREEGKQVIDNVSRKKKNKNSLYKFPTPTKTNKQQPLRTTSQLYAQDNNSSFTQLMIQRYDALKAVTSKRATTTKSVYQPSFNSPKHAALLNECGIDLDHPVLPVDVAQKRAERLAREKKQKTPEIAQRLQLIKAAQQSYATSSGTTTAAAAGATTSTQVQTIPINQTVISTPITSSIQIAVSQAATQSTPIPTIATTTTTAIVTAPATPSNIVAQIRQRIVASPIQAGTPTVVSVSGLSPAQLAATQRLIVSSSAAQGKTVVGAAATVQGKTISPAQLQMLRQVTLKQQFRFQGSNLAQPTMKTATVSLGGQTAVQVQLTAQAQPRAQFIKQGAMAAVTGKQGTRTVTESEISQLLKRQQQIQQQKALAAVAAAAAGAGGSQATAIQPQVFAHTIQSGQSASAAAAAAAGAQVATLVKAVSSSGGNLVTIPVSGVTIGGATVKAALATGSKPVQTNATAQQIRQLQLQHHQLAQKKLVSQKIAGIAQVSGKGGVATQLIVGSKTIPTGMTMQQFQVMRSPLNVSQGPVVLAKAPSRVIPVNTGQGSKQTIQVVAATSQTLANAIRPQSASTLAGALAGIKVQGANVASQAAQQALLSQVSAALQGQAAAVRQSSPVRIQTSGGTPLVAVTVQGSSSSAAAAVVALQQQQQQQLPQTQTITNSPVAAVIDQSRIKKQ